MASPAVPGSSRASIVAGIMLSPPDPGGIAAAIVQGGLLGHPLLFTDCPAATLSSNYPHSHTRRLCSTERKGRRGAVPSEASRSRTVEAGARRLLFVKEAPVKVAVRHGAAGSGRKGRSTAAKRGEAG